MLFLKPAMGCDFWSSLPRGERAQGVTLNFDFAALGSGNGVGIAVSGGGGICNAEIKRVDMLWKSALDESFDSSGRGRAGHDGRREC
jgi:hypothetical protein